MAYRSWKPQVGGGRAEPWRSLEVCLGRKKPTRQAWLTDAVSHQAILKYFD
jgi:hypothetical protein